MQRRRALSFVPAGRSMIVGMAALVVASCGSTTTDLGSEASATLAPVDGDVEVDVATRLTVFADTDLARMVDPATASVEYPRVDGLTAGDGSALLWRLPAVEATAGDVERLADALDVDGDLVPGDPGFGGGWRVGNAGDDTLEVLTSFGPTWTMYRSFDRLAEVGAFPCVTVAVADNPEGGCVGGVEPIAPAPPTADEIDAAVGAVLNAVGVSTDDVELATFAEFGPVVEVRATFTPDGVPSDVMWSVGVAARGLVASGSGPLLAPVPVAEVATVSVAEALERLGRVSTAPVVGAPMQPTTTPPLTTTAPGVDSVRTVAPPTVDPSQFVFPTIMNAEPALVQVWAFDNSPWLVPAVRFSGDNGFVAVIPTISADDFDVIEPGTRTVPQVTGAPVSVPIPPPTATTTTTIPTDANATPPETGPAVPFTTTSLAPPASTFPPPTLPGPDATILIDGVPATVPIPPDPNVVDPFAASDRYESDLEAVLVGSGLADAELVLRRTGWEVRVVDLDGSTELTADFQSNRVTLQHRGGRVVAVLYG